MFREHRDTGARKCPRRRRDVGAERCPDDNAEVTTGKEGDPVGASVEAMPPGIGRAVSSGQADSDTALRLRHAQKIRVSTDVDAVGRHHGSFAK
ncbi:MAG: hypothetical protein QM784_27610 [Polyangiaceae bacterium]